MEEAEVEVEAEEEAPEGADADTIAAAAARSPLFLNGDEDGMRPISRRNVSFAAKISETTL